MSMIYKMIFNARLRWVLEAAPTFGPHNRVSNVMHRTARGRMAPVGSPENGDAGELMRALGDGAVTDLSDKSELLVQCLQKLWESAGADGERERCSKLFIGKPSGSTAGVEGLFTGDGVMVAHVFQITAESPADAVDMLVHLLVSYCALSAKAINAMNRREISSEHAAFKFHSAMPCVDEMCGKQRGSPPCNFHGGGRLQRCVFWVEYCSNA
ncbi:unnamed protein product [Ectocarpus sp. CCAP 1310/34]|nr:unnamed protein product [Ectocarpus sp. CCAP 1310/34]